jgi:nitrilase
MRAPVTVACVQAEPVILDRDATIEKLGRLAAEAAGNDAKLLVFPGGVHPRVSVVGLGARAGRVGGAGRQGGLRPARSGIARVPSEAADRLAEIARENEVWLVTGVTERDPSGRERSTTHCSTTRLTAPWL